MGMLLSSRQSGLLRDLTKHPIERAAVHHPALLTDKQVVTAIPELRSLFQPSGQDFLLTQERLAGYIEHVLNRLQTAFLPLDRDIAILKVYIRKAQPAHFGRPQPMFEGEQDHCVVTERILT